MITWNTKANFGAPFSQQIFRRFSFALAFAHYYSILEECAKALVFSLTDS
jgi:hypothetical protein